VLGLGLAAGAGLATVGPAVAVPAILLPPMHSEYTRFDTLPVVRPQHVPSDPGMLFYVQQSIDANVIVYAARVGADGRLDPDQPMEVFWRRYATKGHRRELSFFERMFAFGVACSREAEGVWSVRLAAFPGRAGRLDLGPDGRPRFLLDIERRPMRPLYVYAEAIGDGFIPTIRHVDIFAVAEGEKGYVRERVIFD
jgi:hypothetical protein